MPKPLVSPSMTWEFVAAGAVRWKVSHLLWRATGISGPTITILCGPHGVMLARPSLVQTQQNDVLPEAAAWGEPEPVGREEERELGKEPEAV